MPVVPKYDQFQAMPTVQPQARFDAPQMADTAGRQAQEMGRSLLSAGGQLGQVALDMQREANKVLVRASRNELQNGMRGLLMEAVQLTGRAALDRPDGKSIVDEYGERAKKLREGIDKTLKNDAQRQMFAAVFDDEWQSLSGKLGSHMLKEQKQFEIDTEKSELDNAYSNGYTFAALDADRNKAMAQAAGVLEARIKRAGLDPSKDAAMIESIRRETMSPFHANVMKSFMDNGNAAGAKAYYDQHSAEMTTQARTNFAESINRMNDELVTGGRVRELVADESMTLSAAVKVIEQEYGKDPAKLKMARTELNYQFDMRNTIKRENEERLLAPVNAVIGDALNAGRAIGKGEREGVLRNLRSESPELYAKAAGAIDQHNDEIRAERRAAEAHYRAMAESSPSAKLAGLEMKYEMLTNPNKYKGADMRQVLFPLVRDGKIKISDAEELIDMQAKLRDPAKRAEMTTLLTGNEYLNVRLNGITVNGTKYADLDKARQQEIRNKALMAAEPLLQSLQAGGTKASTDDVKRVVDSLFVERRYRDAIFPGGFVPYGAVKTRAVLDEAGAPGRAGYAAIPEAARSKIEAALRKNGYTPTPEMVIEYYNAGSR